MKKNLIILTILAGMSKFLGFFREILMSYFYGTNSIADCYLMACSTAGICMGWLTTLAVVHTPLYQEIREKQSLRKAERFTNQIILIEIFLGFVSLIFFRLISRRIIDAVAIGFSVSMKKTTYLFFSWAIISLIFSAISQIYISEMNCKEEFVAANMTNIFLSVIQMLVILVSGYNQRYELLKYAMPLSSGIQLFILIILLSKKRRTYKIGKVFKDKLKKFFLLIVPIFISTMMDDVNAFVDKMFGSTLDEGSIAALNYAHLIKQLFFYILATSMVTIIYPKLSESFAKGNKKSFTDFFKKGIEYMAIVFAITMCILIVFARPITEVVYERGEFGENSVILTMQSLMMYATALFPLAIREVLVRAFQAMQNTKINMIVGIFSVLINILFNFILVRPLGHMGLALSTSIAAYFTLPVLFFLFSKQIRELKVKKIFYVIVRTLFASAISSSLMYILFYTWLADISSFLIKLVVLLFAGVVGVIIYIFILFILRVDVIREMVGNIINRKKQN